MSVWRQLWSALRRSIQGIGASRSGSPRPRWPQTSTPPTGESLDGRTRSFDPALRQFEFALRPEDPSFASDAERRRHGEQHLRVMAQVLHVLSRSAWRHHLVLRGSALLRAWFGERARPPKDLDFVVVPRDWDLRDADASAMLGGLVEALLADPCPGVQMRREDVAQDDIWTYDRVPGTRLVLPWTAEGIPWGSIQLDFVFGEDLPEPPQELSLRLVDDGPVTPVLAASPALSLAWKLLWLETDISPQAKDLHDAALLAESTSLSRALLERVFREAGERPPTTIADNDIPTLEWAGVPREEDSVVEEWQQRIRAAVQGPETD